MASETPDPCNPWYHSAHTTMPMHTHHAMQMPDEFNYDPDIIELKEEIRVLQEAFKETHKQNEAVKSLNK